MLPGRRLSGFIRRVSTQTKPQGSSNLKILNESYVTDDFTNVSPKILSHVGRSLINEEGHPLNLLKRKVVDYFYARFKGHMGNPVFSVYDNLPPVVTVHQNFDSLLIPTDHVSRAKSDCYYVNRGNLLRAHTTAHQSELVKMGLDNFLVFGDVYRRDEIDRTHYPVFHQADALRLCTQSQLTDRAGSEVVIFEGRNGKETPEKQAEHSIDATKVMETELKSTLVGLAQSLFGKNIQYRWVDVYFPFTHPSWELEVHFNGDWLEVLGCGITRHAILRSAGAERSIGWAFGLGLERLAMRLYDIPDIRLFWSRDSGFLSQFQGKKPTDNIRYKPVSIYPQCYNDISFWLPEDGFETNDFYELARETAGDLLEQVTIQDDFTHPKTGQRSLCFRLTYRHLERTLTKEEVNKVHETICDRATERLRVKIR
uniref:Phenylalanine--tRNA ligase, mitochondrial n=1 Tax=Lygus hesperus TaxID=30085 RepID=A0A0K8TI82_LYGHE